jgi:hypothetical protein
VVGIFITSDLPKHYNIKNGKSQYITISAVITDSPEKSKFEKIIPPCKAKKLVVKKAGLGNVGK